MDATTMLIKKRYIPIALFLFALLSSACSNKEYSYDPKLPMGCRAVAEFMTEPAIVAAGEDKIPNEVKGQGRDGLRRWVEEMMLNAHKSEEDCLLFLGWEIEKLKIDKFIPPICLQYRTLFKEKMDAKGFGERYTANRIVQEDSNLYRLKSVRGEAVLKNFCEYAISVWQENAPITEDEYRKLKAAYPLPQPCEENLVRLESQVFKIEKEPLSESKQQKRVNTIAEMVVKRVHSNYLFKKNPEVLANKCVKVGMLLQSR
ncbi:hypothetical protein [Leminorella richardii]|nr:hypothetical protein [Leminorella richardii]